MSHDQPGPTRLRAACDEFADYLKGFQDGRIWTSVNDPHGPLRAKDKGTLSSQRKEIIEKSYVWDIGEKVWKHRLKGTLIAKHQIFATLLDVQRGLRRPIQDRLEKAIKRQIIIEKESVR